MESATQQVVHKFGFPVNTSSWNEAVSVEDELRFFIERHHQSLRRESFDMLLQPPFSPLDLDVSMEVQQDRVWKCMRRLFELGRLDSFIKPWQTAEDSQLLFAGMECVGMHDLSLGTALGAQLALCGFAINSMGSDQQRDKYLRDLLSCEMHGCFAMTELGHGSNVRDVETTAIYDPQRKEFVINTPCTSAQKFWIGNATHAHVGVVMAQLYTQGRCHGVHGFIVQMRDMATNTLQPGLQVADVGHKMGLNGVSNGRIWFNNVRVPHGNLLNRYGSVDEAGNYSSFIEDSNARFAICLAELLRGRIVITSLAAATSKVAVGTAIRYALARRQFRVGNQQETLLMDYPMHQRRLFPYLAMIYALQSSAHHVQREWEGREEDIMLRMMQMKDIHVLSAGFKAISGWFARDALQACREACGGQGYASWNRIGPLKADFDASLTYEGDNCVLLAQATRQLMKVYLKGLANGKYAADGFLVHFNGLGSAVNPLRLSFAAVWNESDGGAGRYADVSRKFDATLLRHPYFLLCCLQVRERLYLGLLSAQLQAERQKAKQTVGEQFCEDAAWNACGPLAVDCGQAFFERLSLQWFLQDIEEMSSKSSHQLLGKLASLYGLWLLLRDARFCGTSALTDDQKEEMRAEFDALLAEIRPHARCLVDGLGVPDQFLGAVGHASDSNDDFWSYAQTTRNSAFAGQAKL